MSVCTYEGTLWVYMYDVIRVCLFACIFVVSGVSEIEVPRKILNETRTLWPGHWTTPGASWRIQVPFPGTRAARMVHEGGFPD